MVAAPACTPAEHEARAPEATRAVESTTTGAAIAPAQTVTTEVAPVLPTTPAPEGPRALEPAGPIELAIVLGYGRRVAVELPLTKGARRSVYQRVERHRERAAESGGDIDVLGVLCGKAAGSWKLDAPHVERSRYEVISASGSETLDVRARCIAALPDTGHAWAVLEEIAGKRSSKPVFAGVTTLHTARAIGVARPADAPLPATSMQLVSRVLDDEQLTRVGKALGSSKGGEIEAEARASFRARRLRAADVTAFTAHAMGTELVVVRGSRVITKPERQPVAGLLVCDAALVRCKAIAPLVADATITVAAIGDADLDGSDEVLFEVHGSEWWEITLVELDAALGNTRLQRVEDGL